MKELTIMSVSSATLRGGVWLCFWTAYYVWVGDGLFIISGSGTWASSLRPHLIFPFKCFWAWGIKYWHQSLCYFIYRQTTRDGCCCHRHRPDEEPEAQEEWGQCALRSQLKVAEADWNLDSLVLRPASLVLSTRTYCPGRAHIVPDPALDLISWSW